MSINDLRILTHPSFSQVAGDGIYTYDCNPDETLNLILEPARRVDTTVQRTIGSSILVQQVEDLGDVVITETWLGGDKLSMPAVFYRKLHSFWITTPEIGEYVTWQPCDVNDETYNVEIVDLQLGTGIEIKYREYRDDYSTSEGSYVRETVTLKFKIVRDVILPQGSIVLAGV